MRRLTKREQLDFLNWMIDFRTVDTHSIEAWDAVNGCINELCKKIYRDAPKVPEKRQEKEEK